MRVNTRETNLPLPAKPTVIVHNGEAHSRVVGGSSAKIRLLCNASRVEEEKSPRSTNVWADRGTALHHVVEVALTEDLTNVQVLRQFTGVAIKQDDMVHTIDLTADLLKQKVLPALAYFDATVPGDADFWIERKLPMLLPDAVGGLPDATELMRFDNVAGGFGTGDVFFASRKTGRAGVIDWKFGDGIMVPAEDNDQMRFYLVLGIMAGLLPVQEEYEAHIFQPADSREPEEFGSVGIYKFEDLVRFNRDLYDAVTSPVVYNPGEHCARCNGRITCKAFSQMLTLAVETDVPDMSAKQLASALKMIPGMEAWIKDVKAAALRNAQTGVDIPGFKLEQALGNSAWVDEAAALRAMASKGVPADVRQVKVAISPTQALKCLAEIGTGKKEIERFTKTHIFRPENGERLVAAKREEEAKSSIKKLATALKARGL
jgi:hypothetical protein